MKSCPAWPNQLMIVAVFLLLRGDVLTDLPFPANAYTHLTKGPYHKCTVLYASDGSTALGGNNEDWSDSNTRMWFYPASDDCYGWVKFGFAGGYPQGGMNDQGLFWDATGCAWLDMPHSGANKQYYRGSLMEKIIKECGSVAEARRVLNRYYCDDQFSSQYLIGDSSGHSMIVEGDSILEKNSTFQVLTNFYHSRPDLGGYPCWRYDKARSMLEEGGDPTPYLFGSVLSATHQEGRYPTQYSNIYDLKRREVYLFYFHNFEEFIIIPLEDELFQGYRSYDLAPLFCGISDLCPSNGERMHSSRVTFQWTARRTGHYQVQYTTDSAFHDYITLDVFQARTPPNGIQLLSWIPLLFCFLSCLRKRWIVSRAVLWVAVLFLLVFSFCQEEHIDPSEPSMVEFSVRAENLSADTTYYWKVLARADKNADFTSESPVQRFRTSL